MFRISTIQPGLLLAYVYTWNSLCDSSAKNGLCTFPRKSFNLSLTAAFHIPKLTQPTHHLSPLPVRVDLHRLFFVASRNLTGTSACSDRSLVAVAYF